MLASLTLRSAPLFDVPEIQFGTQIGILAMVMVGILLFFVSFTVLVRAPAALAFGAMILGLALIGGGVGLSVVVDGDHKAAHADAIVTWADDEYGIELSPDVTSDLLDGESISVEYRSETVSIRAEKNGTGGIALYEATKGAVLEPVKKD